MASHQQMSICKISDDLETKLKKFRFRKDKNVAALVMKIDPDNLTVITDEIFEDVGIEEIVAELPEHIPRYVALSYVNHHDDGRISYPLVFIFISPAGTKPELQMMYAGSKLEVVNRLCLSKVFELRELEEFTEEWLLQKLAFFK